MIIVTGATGHLGRLVVEELLKSVPATEIGVAVRNPAKAADLAARGIDVRHADYDKPETLDAAFAGASKILLISASEVGRRLSQHQTAIDAIRRSGARLLVYTSLLNADTTGMSLASEHWPTEELVKASGIPFVILRNGWYFENYTENFGPALQYGAISGSAGNGRIAAASRADYAAAAANVLTESGHEGNVYELAGDESFSMNELAAELSRVAGKTIVYNDLPVAEYRAMLASFGLPPAVAYMLADADAAIARGELLNDRGDLHRLIARPTTKLSDAIKASVP
jgi:NAD(P)H dehydrogenase (quinone)